MTIIKRFTLVLNCKLSNFDTQAEVTYEIHGNVRKPTFLERISHSMLGTIIHKGDMKTLY